jgi:hypothetical protein
MSALAWLCAVETPIFAHYSDECLLFDPEKDMICSTSLLDGKAF